jgi:uncharacterized protein (DUF488 family)
MTLRAGATIRPDMNLYTFGYQGLGLDAFVSRLRAAGVRRLIDVRETPFSRKPGFSKGALSSALVAHGISYTHMAALGCPRPIRERYKADGDWAAYERAFLEYLETQGAPLRAVAELANAEAACLLCFEADFGRCHRTFVVRAAVRAGAPFVVHLTADGEVSDSPGARLAGQGDLALGGRLPR